MVVQSHTTPTPLWNSLMTQWWLAWSPSTWRWQRSHHPPLKIFRVCSYRYLRVHISEDLTRTTNITSLVKKDRQHLYHLRLVWKFKIFTGLQKTFLSAAIQSVISGGITTWYSNCSDQDWKSLHRVIRCAEHTTRTTLPCLQDIYTWQCRSSATRIMTDSRRPNHGLCVKLSIRTNIIYHTLIYTPCYLHTVFFFFCKYFYIYFLFIICISIIFFLFKFMSLFYSLFQFIFFKLYFLVALCLCTVYGVVAISVHCCCTCTIACEK